MASNESTSLNGNPAGQTTMSRNRLKETMAGVQHLRELCRQKRWSEDEARVVLSEARKSALELYTFAEGHGLAPQRLYHWAAGRGETPASLGASKVTNVSAE